MVKTLAAVGVLAIAGSALAAPFSVAGAQIGASGNFATPDIFPGTPAALLLAAGGGVFWDSPALDAAAPGTQGSNLIGANGGSFPAAGGPASSGVGALVIAPDNFSGSGDSSFNVAWTIPNPAAHVASAPGAFSDNDVWIGRLAGDNVQVDFLQIILTQNVGDNRDLVIDGDGVDFGGSAGVLFAKSIDNGNGSFDIIITDAPAPGAAALLGLAGVAGLRRRRA